MKSDRASSKDISGKRPFLSQRPRQRLSYRMLVLSACSFMLVFSASLFVYFQFGRNEKAYAATMTAVANGNWSSPSTWSANRVPANNDSITIPAGKTVTMDVVTVQYSNMKVTVTGTLHFNGGKKLNMCPGTVVVNSTGLLTGDNNGSKIDICNNPVWTGANDQPGPVTLTTGGILPIELMYFDAELIASDIVSLKWATATETNNDYFTVERSSNGTEFKPLIKLFGAGNSTATQSYMAVDDQPFQGSSYYRLKQTDYDGSFTFSQIVHVWNSDKTKPQLVIEEIYPNPVTDHFKIRFTTVEENNVTLNVTSPDGKLVSTQKIHSQKGLNQFTFQNAGNMPDGNYLISLSSEFEKVSKMISKN